MAENHKDAFGNGGVGNGEMIIDLDNLHGSLKDQQELYSEDEEDMSNDAIFSQGSWRKPTSIEWRDICYEVDMKNKCTKKILKGVSGLVQPGELLVILGSSGAGKTTLLNMLAGRLSAAGNGRSSGQVLVNGMKRDYTRFRSYTAYVLQEDYFFPDLTVRETIMFSAALRLPSSIDAETKSKRVDMIIAETGLAKCEHSKIGNEMRRGISGGERKRLNIATEIVTDPSLIFLDEPTSGLDAFTAQNIMHTMLKLARNGRAVVATIHQPRSSIFQMFDKLLLLTDGQCVYFGPARDATAYFASLGHPCPQNFNPADYFIDLIALDNRSKVREARTRERIAKLTAAYREHEKLVNPTPAAILSPRASLLPASSEDIVAVRDDQYAVGWGMQFLYLYRRSLQNVMRNKLVTIITLTRTLIISLILGAMWLKIGDITEGNEIQAISGAIFFLLINSAFSGIFGIMFSYPTERGVVSKERASRTYRASAYFLAKNISELIRPLVATFILVVIIYYMVNLRAGFQYFLGLFGIVLLGLLTAEGIALTLFSATRTPEQASAFVPLILIISMLFAGFFIRTDLIPSWLRWVRYFSFMRYAFSLAMQLLFTDYHFTITCSDGDFCPKDGEGVLEYYNLNELTWYGNLLALVFFMVGCRLLAYYFVYKAGAKFDHSI